MLSKLFCLNFSIIVRMAVNYNGTKSIIHEGSAVAWWLMPRTPDPEVGGSSPTRVKPCCVLEQGTFTPKNVLVIPRKRSLRPNMTEKLFTGTLRINQPTNFLKQFNNVVLRQDDMRLLMSFIGSVGILIVMSI